MFFKWIPVFTGALFAGMLVCVEIGYLMGRRPGPGPGEIQAGTGVVTGAVITILGLLLGFSFSAGESRMDKRRDMIVEETNAIGTAYLRLDLLPAEDQPALRDLFRKYLDTRLAAYYSAPDIEEAKRKLEQASELSSEIWVRAESALRKGGRETTALLVLPSLNAMIDIASARTAVLLHHAPPLIFVLLCGLALFSAVLVGYTMGEAKWRNLFQAVLFALVVSGTVYVVMDLEFPRSGLIRMDREDRALFALQKDLREK